jgi:type IV secretory pathway VirJ component
VVALLAVAGYMVHTRAPRVEPAARLGQVRLYPAWFATTSFVYVFSGARGWSTADEDSARDFARRGSFVVGIDTPQFLNFMDRAETGCVYLPGQLEDYSRAQQREAGNAQYLAPLLLGHDIGGTLVYMAQLQALPVAFNAAVAVDPQSQIALQRPFCDHPAITPPQPPGPNVPLRVVLDADATPTEREFAVEIPGDTAGSVVAGKSLYASYRAALASIAAGHSGNGVADLPLAEVAAAAPKGDAFAIIYSGDGGWRDLDRMLADVLAAKGMSVVGVDVLRYYWTQKAPPVAAGDLARIIRYYQKRWQRSKVVLIGFSLGANVLPFLVSRLPPDLKQEVSLVSLLSPERTTAFEVETTGWLGVHNNAGMPIGPELKKLSGQRVQCIYGTDEGADSLCTTDDATAAGAAVIAKSGGHHFDHNYEQLADQILAAVPQ